MVSPYSAARHTAYRRKRAEPGQCSGVNWLQSMMATTADSENMRGCNSFAKFIPGLSKKTRHSRRVQVREKPPVEAAIAMYDDSRFRRVPYLAHLSPF
jgi:hypothetical protein